MISLTVSRNLIGLEDLLIGTGTATQTRGNSSVEVTKINGSNLPYDETYSLKEKFDTLTANIDSLPVVVDGDGNLLTGAIDTSDVDLSATHPDRLWRKSVDVHLAEIYYGNVLLFQYDETDGNIIIPTDQGYVGGDTVVTNAYIDAINILASSCIAAYETITTSYEHADKLLQDQIDALTAQIAGLAIVIPVGTIIYVPYSTVDVGFAKCNRQELDRIVYAELFSKIGTTFGTGDGVTTFNVPEIRGEFIRCWDDSRGVDAARAIGSFQSDLFKSHTHTLSNVGSPNDSGSGGPSRLAPTSGISSGATGGAETRPRNVAFQALIKIM